ncbi:SphA family protein [Pseudoxanthomonas spadix]|uniref:SphA family protein n=1 Tax=Pseudoxanthomonas spadix TaxID=415229 RepID=UPI000F00224A|nr:transporter [Pseudoxanthomonas spadix]MBP3973065.1 transporter [Pseudoxanthomonas spadix]RMW97207.1 hypothetical protein D9R12_03590 [Pseudoxanthomonas spadix]
MKSSRKLARSIYFALAASFSHAACATELGLTNYPIGVNGILDGILPRPGGTVLLNYYFYDKSTKYINDKGDSGIPDFENTTFVGAFRTIHTWNYSNGGWTISSAFNVPIVRSKTSIMGMSDTDTGIGAIDLEPIHVNYVNPSNTFFSSFFVDIFIKSGGYDSRRLANVHQNYNAITPLYSYTWFINRNWSTSATTGIEFPLERNDETLYKSGDVFFIHPSVEYTPTSNPKLHFGFSPYYIKQLSDDKLPGVRIEGGGQTRATGLGASVRYDFSEKVSAVLKYNNEVSARNRSESDPLWFQIGYIF